MKIIKLNASTQFIQSMQLMCTDPDFMCPDPDPRLELTDGQDYKDRLAGLVVGTKVSQVYTIHIHY